MFLLSTLMFCCAFSGTSYCLQGGHQHIQIEGTVYCSFATPEEGKMRVEPAVQANITLYEADWLSRDVLAATQTDGKGRFSVQGSKWEWPTLLSPFIVVRTTCTSADTYFNPLAQRCAFAAKRKYNHALGDGLTSTHSFDVFVDTVEDPVECE